MEPPISLGERDLRDRKVDVLRSVRALEAARSRRARYRGYVDEDGVTPEHHTVGEPAEPNLLRFELDPEALSLELTGTGPGVDLSLVPMTLSARMQPPELPAYGRILLDVLQGNSALSIRADEAEESWRVVTPVLDGWARGIAPLEEYEPGSEGPR